MEKEYILLSGGLDSTLLAYDLKRCQNHKNLYAIYIDHGQLAAEKEKEAATNVANDLDIPLKIIDISGLWPSFEDVAGDSHLHVMTSSAISPSAGILIGANYVAWAGAKKLYIGLVKEDIDGRPWLNDLLDHYNCALSCIKPSLKSFPLGGDEFDGFKIIAPYKNDLKEEIIRKLYTFEESQNNITGLGIKSLIDSSWSCQHSDDKECGTCFICKLKQDAVKNA